MLVFLLISDFVTEVWMVQFNLLTMSMSMKIHVKLFNYMVNGNSVFPCCSFPLPSCFPCPNFLCLPYPTLLTSGQLFRFFLSLLSISPSVFKIFFLFHSSIASCHSALVFCTFYILFKFLKFTFSSICILGPNWKLKLWFIRYLSGVCL